MKTLCVINAIEDVKSLEYEVSLRASLSQKADSMAVEEFKLRELKTAYCIGCWDCWLKTPGICRLQDDHVSVYTSFINANEALFIIPIKTGFVSALFKKTLDRIIPSVLPYTRMYQGELHHQQRYPKRPNLRILLIKQTDTTDEEVELIRDYFDRVIKNFHSEILSFDAIDKIEEVNNAVANM